ncbi:MAG: 4Fe-4S binding protein [Prevotellaceae bacterium]|jgi:NADH-quinone oxidoreductase subunit I|nr:4Fe-4S binding protein [Prevotellaceae bacterium]
MNITTYLKGFFNGLWSLLVGMKTTLRIFFRKKTTECYPENRGTLKMFDRFRGELTLIHNENNEHKCIACGICELNCPNHTIRVVSEKITDADGKTTRVLQRYEYDLGSCMFCELCTRTCPHGALAFTPTFENAVYTRSKLVLKLNREGSKLANKK